jgi:glycosyltransferase involved in cell wall biosynthesis
LGIADENLSLELLIVDDRSTDHSLAIAEDPERSHPQIRHQQNMGKGAALRTGFQRATGDFVAVHDADLEYDPMDLKMGASAWFAKSATCLIGLVFNFIGKRYLVFPEKPAGPWSSKKQLPTAEMGKDFYRKTSKTPVSMARLSKEKRR